MATTRPHPVDLPKARRLARGLERKLARSRHSAAALLELAEEVEELTRALGFDLPDEPDDPEDVDQEEDDPGNAPRGRARAIRRCGELLREIPAKAHAPGRHVKDAVRRRR